MTAPQWDDADAPVAAPGLPRALRSRAGAAVVALTGGLLVIELVAGGGPYQPVRVGGLALLAIVAVGIAGLLQEDPETMRAAVFGAGRAAPPPAEPGLAFAAFAAPPGSALPALDPAEVEG